MSSIKDRIYYIIHKIKTYSRCKVSIESYKEGIKRINKRSSISRNIIFLMNFPESWNSVKSIYEEAIKREELNVIVVAVPIISDDVGLNVAPNELKNEAYEYFLNAGIKAVKANRDDGQWLNLREYDPDCIIMTRPYNAAYPPIYRSYALCRYAKLFYIPYAYSMLSDNMIYSVLPEDFIQCMHRVFLANESRKNECIKKMPSYGKITKDRFKYLGFPRFDLYQFDSDIIQRIDDRFVIAWMPRWTTDDSKGTHKASHFLMYYKQFIAFADANPDIYLIIRPHPKMINHYIRKGLMTKEEVDAFIDKCQNSPNLELDQDKNYMSTIKKSDVLVADYTSLIAEFYMTGKPIVFCDTADGLNYEGKMICDSLYKAASFEEIIRTVSYIKTCDDGDFDKRQKIIRELIPSKTGEIGKNILNEIINS